MDYSIFNKPDPSGMLSKEKYLKKHYPEIYQSIIEFCNTYNLQDLKFSQKVWHTINNVTSVPICKNENCNNIVKFQNRTLGYLSFCSNKCQSSSKYTKEKRKQTSLKRYGVEIPQKLDEIKNKQRQTINNKPNDEKEKIKEKRKQTLIKHYGVDNPAKSKILLEKRVKSFKKNIDQYKKTYKKTSLERHGTEHPWKNKDIHQKTFNTYKKNTGYSHPLLNPNIKDKIRQTNLERYEVEHPLQSKEIQEKNKQTNLERYGVENVYQSELIKKKIKQTNLERYGVEHPLQLKEFQDKIKQTNLERYGVENVYQSKEIQDKIKRTNLDRYGVEYPLQSKEIQNKIRQTNLERYGIEHYNQSNEYKEKQKIEWENKQLSRFKKYNIVNLDYDNHEITFKCNKCNKKYTLNSYFAYQRNKFNIELCTNCNPINSYSSFHNKICEFLDELNIKYIKNDRSIISPLELDIYIPRYNIAIEVNGIYWHSELFKDKFYHQNKLNLAYEKGVRLIQIWEDDWNLKQNIIKHRLKIIFNKEKVLYARKCKIKELNFKEYKEFLNTYHLQGSIVTKIKLGLFYNDELVSVIGFGNLRKSMNQKSKEHEYELYRFVEKYHVVGGLNKLFKYFVYNYKPAKIITYQDLDWGYSNLYEKLDFKLEKITDPGYFYVVNEIRENRFKYRKDQLIKEGFDKNKTEHEIMLERGYYRIYNSGNLKWNLIL